MGSFSSLGIGLSFIFGCVLMGIVAELYYLLWWKKKRVLVNSPKKPLFCWKSFNNGGQEFREEEDLEVGSNKNSGVAEGVDLELMRMHNLCGPPRFLFSITEESKEDLESEDGRSRRGLSTLSSPIVKSPTCHGFNPLFESITEEEVNRLRSSPPPKFKFLKDAEDKLIRKTLMEEKKNQESDTRKDACFVKLSNQAAQVLPLPSSPMD